WVPDPRLGVLEVSVEPQRLAGCTTSREALAALRRIAADAGRAADIRLLPDASVRDEPAAVVTAAVAPLLGEARSAAPAGGAAGPGRRRAGRGAPWGGRRRAARARAQAGPPGGRRGEDRRRGRAGARGDRRRARRRGRPAAAPAPLRRAPIRGSRRSGATAAV